MEGGRGKSGREKEEKEEKRVQVGKEVVDMQLKRYHKIQKYFKHNSN